MSLNRQLRLTYIVKLVRVDLFAIIHFGSASITFQEALSSVMLCNASSWISFAV